MATENLPAVPLPPGGPIEIVFSFDTTGSMATCLPQVRAHLAHVIERLSADIPGLRVAVFAHGDYSDLEQYGYITKHIDFTDDVVELCKFVNEVGPTGGLDFEECYELVLRQVREDLSWQPGTQRALVMIGDAPPHDVDFYLNTLNIDWKEEVEKLSNEMGVRIYAVQCLNNAKSDAFYEHLASATGGKRLQLDNLTSIVEMMMAVCYCEKGAEFVEAYAQEVRNKNMGGMHADLERMFGTLKDIEGKAASTSAETTSAPSTPFTGPAGSVFTTPFIVTPPSTPGSSKKAASRPSTSGYRPRSGSLSSVGSSLGSSGSRGRRRSSKGLVLTRSRAHPMTRRPKPPQDIPKRRRKSTKSITKKCAEKVQMEKTARKDFILSKLRWSHWKEAMAGETPKTEDQDWEDRLSDHPGFKRTTLFKDIHEPAVYEMAVKPPNCTQKVPVMASVSRGIQHGSWEAGLLSLPHIRSQVDRVLQRKCKLYIRRAKFTKEDQPGVQVMEELLKKASATGDAATTKEIVYEMRKLMNSTCDYAWKKHYDPESKRFTHRSLVKKGVVISD